MVETSIYTDGTYYRKKRACGYAIVVVIGDMEVATRNFTTKRKELKRGVLLAEMLGIYEALKYAKDKHLENVVVYSDCQSLVNTVRSVLKGGKRAFQNKKTNEDYQFLDVLADITMVASDNVRIEWVKGHNGNKWNEKADKLAKMGAQGIFRRLHHGKKYENVKKESSGRLIVTRAFAKEFDRSYGVGKLWSREYREKPSFISKKFLEYQDSNLVYFRIPMYVWEKISKEPQMMSHAYKVYWKALLPSGDQIGNYDRRRFHQENVA